MNSKLRKRVFDIPQNILDKIRHTITGLGDMHVHGRNRAERLLKDKKVKYGQLKRIIHDLENMDIGSDKVRYDLYGGKEMIDWSTKFLDGERQLIKDKKDASANINKNTGVERKNPFLKKHTKKTDSVIPRFELGIKSNSQKSVVSPLKVSTLFEEIKRIKKRLNRIEMCSLFILVGISITMFPLFPSGSYFNNWLLIITYFPIGFYLSLKGKNVCITLVPL